MQCRIVSCFEELEDLAIGWDRLWTANPYRQIFNRFSFARAWWRGYGSSVSLCTPVAISENRVVGILPLVLENKHLRFLGDPGADYNDILCDPTSSDRILEVLFEGLEGIAGRIWSRAIFSNISEHSLFLTLLPKLPAQWHKRLVTTAGHLCPTVILDANNAKSPLQSFLSRQEPRRHERQLQKLGKLTFRHVEDPAEIRRHLPVFFEQHTQRWAMAALGNQNFLSQQSRTFYEALLEQMDPRKELRFAVLELDGRPVAYHLGFQVDRKFIFYKSTFDINLWELSPGQVMLRSLFSYAQDSAVNEFDFTIGNEAFKNRFANHMNRNFTVRLYPPGLASLVESKVLLLRNRVAQDQRPLFVLLKTVRAKLMSHSRRIRESLHRDGFWKQLGGLAVAAFRAVVHAKDEVLLISIDRGVFSRLDMTPNLDANLSVGVATLGDLANCTAKEPGTLDRSKLQSARVRIRQGDAPYLARVGGKLGCLAWIGIHNEFTPAELGLECYIRLEKPVVLIYGLWIAPGLGEPISRNVLRALFWASHKRGQDTWICCWGKDVVLRQAIDQAGFLLRYRVARTRFFGHVQTSWQPVNFTSRHAEVRHQASDLDLIRPPSEIQFGSRSKIRA